MTTLDRLHRKGVLDREKTGPRVRLSAAMEPGRSRGASRRGSDSARSLRPIPAFSRWCRFLSTRCRGAIRRYSTSSSARLHAGARNSNRDGRAPRGNCRLGGKRSELGNRLASGRSCLAVGATTDRTAPSGRSRAGPRRITAVRPARSPPLPSRSCSSALSAWSPRRRRKSAAFCFAAAALGGLGCDADRDREGRARWRATMDALSQWTTPQRAMQGDISIITIDEPFPVVAVVGIWRPRLYIARHVSPCAINARLRR